MNKIFILMAMLFFLVSISANAELTTSVDREKLSPDETVTLTISSDERTSDKPNLDILLKDFQIISQGQRSQISIVNGQISSHIDWVVSMLPKHAGTIVIPAITVGSDKTQPLEIQVEGVAKPVAEVVTRSNKDIFMETSVSPLEGYVQQQLNYTIKIYFRRRLDEAFLVAPILPNANISPVGQDVSYATVKKGQFYRVLERSYIIIPQQEGNYEISAPVLTGVIEKEPADIFDFSSFMSSNAVRENIKIVGQKHHVRINPKPAKVKNSWWLPAKQISIKENWQPIPLQVHVGDPITREIIIKATGMKAELLPKIEMPRLRNLNVYSEPVTTQTQTNGRDLIGVQTQKIVMVPTQSGVIHLPEIKIPWWNISTNSQHFLYLPSKTITVLPTSGANNMNASNLAKTPVEKKLTESKTQDSIDFLQASRRFFWPLLVGILFLAWVFTLIFWRRHNKEKRHTLHEDKVLHHTTKTLEQSLHKACEANRADLAKDFLIQWARCNWPNSQIVSLLDIVRQFQNQAGHEKLSQEIKKLDRCIYTNEKSWQGNALWQAFVEWTQQHKQKTKASSANDEDELPPLFLQ